MEYILKDDTDEIKYHYFNSPVELTMMSCGLTIIIDPKFNEPLNDEHIELLSKYKKVIFSNYSLSKTLYDSYEKNEFNKNINTAN